MQFVQTHLLIILFWSGSFTTFSQKDTLITISKDTVETKILSTKKEKPIVVVNADFRQTFVKKSPLTIYGGYIGLRFNHKNLYSIGYYTLSNSSKEIYKTKNSSIQADNEVLLGFLSFGYTHTFFDGLFFKVDIPIEVGVGEGSMGIYNLDGNLIKLRNSKLFPIQAGVSTVIKIIPWFGIHLQAGYRDMFGKSIFQNEYSGLYYTFGFSFNFGAIYHQLKR